MLFKEKNTASKESDSGTIEGFETIYRTHFKMMFAVAYNQLKDSDIAEGLVHNIFLRLWEKREQYTGVEAMDRYLIGAVKRAVMEYIRNKSIRSKHIDMLSLLPETTENYVDLEYEVNELQERVDQLINKLPHQCQVVYKLSREEGKSNKEISSRLDIAEKTVESHMTKALKYLRSNLTEYQV